MSAPDPAPIQNPFAGILAMLGTRKGSIVLGAIAFCMVVYLREPGKLDKILAFLAVVLPTYFGSQAYEDKGKITAAAAESAKLDKIEK